MNNSQAQAYAVVAVKRLLDGGCLSGKKENEKRFLNLVAAEMDYIFDTLTEDEAVRKSEKLL